MHDTLSPDLPPAGLPAPAVDDALLLVRWVPDGDACPVLAASPAAAAVMGSTAGMTSLLHPADRTRFVEEVQRAIAAGRRQVRHRHHRIVGPAGRERWWQTVTTLVPAPAGPGNGVGVICTSHAFDITGDGLEPALNDPLFRALLDSIPDLIFLKDRDSVYLGCNRAFADWFGVDPQWLEGRTDYDLVPFHRELATFFRSHDRAMLAEGRARRFEETVVGANGRTILLETLKTPFFGPSGEVLGLIGVSRDVTAAAQARDALRDSEERVRLLLQSTLDGIFGVDRTGICTLANPAGARLLGFASTDAMIGRAVHGLLPVLANGVTGSLQDETVTRCDGSSFAADIRAAPLMRDGEVIGTVARVTDVTERRRNQDHLRTLSQALDQSRMAVVIADIRGHVSYANPRVTDMTGLARHDIPTLDALLAVLLPAAGQGALGLWRTVLAGESWRQELPLRLPGRSAIRVLLRVFPIQDADGQTTNLLCLAEDITGHHQAEEHIRRVQKMEAVGVLAGGIAHDFNNILLVITGYAHLVFDRLAADDDTRDDVQQIIGAAQRAKDLVGQLLTFSRQDMAEMQVIDLHRTVEEAVKLIAAAIPPAIHLRVISDGAPMTVLAADNQIHQVLVNLCRNAADAIGEAGRVDGSIVVSLAHASVAEPRPLGRATLEPGRYVCLTVADNGCGIPAAMQERIFEPFFTTKPVGKGTGLGLAAVHGIAGRHGALIDVVSSSDLGTSISLYFPYHDAGANGRTGGGVSRILVIGGDEATRGMTARLLRSQGVRVVSTGDDRRAQSLFAIAPRRFDAVVLPTGKAVADEWKRLSLARSLVAVAAGVPVILCQEGGNHELMRLGNEADAAGIVTAPAEPSAFMAFVARIIGVTRIVGGSRSMNRSRGGEGGSAINPTAAPIPDVKKGKTPDGDDTGHR